MGQAVKGNGSERAGSRAMAGQKAAGRARTRKRLKQISYLRRPQEMSLEQWQVALRRQISREQGLTSMYLPSACVSQGANPH